MNADLFHEASLCVIQAGCFLSIVLMVAKKLYKDWKS